MPTMLDTYTHDTNYLINCSQAPTKHHATSLGKKALKAAQLIQEWESRLAFLRGFGTLFESSNNNNSIIKRLIYVFS